MSYCSRIFVSNYAFLSEYRIDTARPAWYNAKHPAQLGRRIPQSEQAAESPWTRPRKLQTNPISQGGDAMETASIADHGNTENKVYFPSAAVREAARVKEYESTYRESIQDIQAYWAARASELEWYRPWDKVLDADNAPSTNGSWAARPTSWPTPWIVTSRLGARTSSLFCGLVSQGTYARCRTTRSTEKCASSPTS